MLPSVTLSLKLIHRNSHSPSPIHDSFVWQRAVSLEKGGKRQSSAPSGSAKPREFVLCTSPLKHAPQWFSLLLCQLTEKEAASLPFQTRTLTKHFGHPPHIINIYWSFLLLLAGQGAGKLRSRCLLLRFTLGQRWCSAPGSQAGGSCGHLHGKATREGRRWGKWNGRVG